MAIYCGNNKLHKSLKKRNVRIGTRYECFKKGVGVGLNLPVDPDYLQPYEPITRRKIFCGNSRMSDEYDRFGNLPECLQKGVAVGKRIKATKRR